MKLPRHLPLLLCLLSLMACVGEDASGDLAEEEITQDVRDSTAAGRGWDRACIQACWDDYWYCINDGLPQSYCDYQNNQCQLGCRL
jgi:hypothetical protein